VAQHGFNLAAAILRIAESQAGVVIRVGEAVPSLVALGAITKVGHLFQRRPIQLAATSGVTPQSSATTCVMSKMPSGSYVSSAAGRAANAP
jgi:hypothetical protein